MSSCCSQRDGEVRRPKGRKKGAGVRFNIQIGLWFAALSIPGLPFPFIYQNHSICVGLVFNYVKTTPASGVGYNPAPFHLYLQLYTRILGTRVPSEIRDPLSHQRFEFQARLRESRTEIRPKFLPKGTKGIKKKWKTTLEGRWDGKKWQRTSQLARTSSRPSMDPSSPLIK